MKENSNLSRPLWMINPWFDSVLLAGFPAVLVVIYLLNHLRLHSSVIFSILSSGFSPFIFITIVHILMTFGTIYLDRDEWIRKPIQFLWLPLFLGIITILSIILWRFNLFSTIMFYWIIWHTLIQSCYILQLHNLRNGNDSKLDNIINNIAVTSGPIYFFIKSSNHIKFDYLGETIFSILINPRLLNWLRIIALCSIVVFMLRKIYLFIRLRRSDIFDIMMVFISNLSFYYALILIRDASIFFMGLRWYHSVQYIAWVLFYHRNKFKAGITDGARFISYLSQPGRYGLYILFFIFVSLTILFISRMASLIFNNSNITQTFILAPMLVPHLLFDSFIWNTKKVKSIIQA